jgi:hypothetical protein
VKAPFTALSKLLNDDICQGGPVLERSGRAHQKVPLLPDYVRIAPSVKQRIETLVICPAIHLDEVLIGPTPQPRHERVPKQTSPARNIFAGLSRCRKPCLI